MPYLKNITRDYVRVGIVKDTREAIRLEPREIVEHIDKDTKERTIRQGEDVVFVSEEVLSQPSVKRSLGRLYVLIDEEEYEQRQEEIWGNRETPGSFALGPNGERIPVMFEQPAESTIIPMDEIGLQEIAGASHGLRSAPQTN